MSAWMCLSAASKNMHDFAGYLSGICVGVCTKTMGFFVCFLTGMLQKNVFLTPAVLLCSCGSVVASEHDGLSSVGIIPRNLSQFLPLVFSSWTNSTFYVSTLLQLKYSLRAFVLLLFKQLFYTKLPPNECLS